LSRPPAPPEPIRAPVGDDAALRGAVRDLRAAGEVVVAELGGAIAGAAGSPGRRLVETGGRWTVAQR
jgi:hypothetical protein